MPFWHLDCLVVMLEHISTGSKARFRTNARALEDYGSGSLTNCFGLR